MLRREEVDSPPRCAGGVVMAVGAQGLGADKYFVRVGYTEDRHGSEDGRGTFRVYPSRPVALGAPVPPVRGRRALAVGVRARSTARSITSSRALDSRRRRHRKDTDDAGARGGLGAPRHAGEPHPTNLLHQQGVRRDQAARVRARVGEQRSAGTALLQGGKSGYLKLFQLSKPDLSRKPVHGLPPALCPAERDQHVVEYVRASELLADELRRAPWNTCS